MKLYVDNKVYEINSKDSLNDFADRIYDEIRSQKKIVQYIEINNDKYEFIEDWFDKVQFEDLVTVKLVTKDLEILIQETIEELNGYLPKLIKGIDLLVDNINKNQFELISDIFVNFIDGLDWVKTAIDNICNIRGKSSIVGERLLANVLQEILEAWESRDFVLLSDLLLYELKPLVEKWNKSLNELTLNYKS